MRETVVEKGGETEKRGAWNVSPIGERGGAEGNSKFTVVVLAKAGEKFRENNDEIKRSNVCTYGVQEPWAVALPSHFYVNVFQQVAFMHCTTPEC